MKGCIPSTVPSLFFTQMTESRGHKYFPAGSQKHKCRMSTFRKLAGKTELCSADCRLSTHKSNFWRSVTTWPYKMP